MLVEFWRQRWEALRSDVAADDTTLITTFEYANPTYVAGKWTIPKEISTIVIALWGKDGDGDTGSYKLFGRAKMNGPIEAVAAGNLICGSQVITKEPILKTTESAYWVDSITNTIEWIKTPVIKNNANNGICYLCVNAKHLQDVYLEITNVGGTAPEMTELNAIITGMAEA